MSISRRNLVASAAALPALAVPAVALASVEPDPIFTALKIYEEAAAGEEAGFAARSNADDAFKAKYGGYFPSALRKGYPENKETRMDRFWLREHSAISKFRKDLKADTIAEMHRELNRQTADYATNTQPIHDAADEASDRRMEAAGAVFETVPTTLAGLRAKVDFAMSTEHISEGLTNTDTAKPLHDFLDTLYRSAAIIAGLPEPAPAVWKGEEEES